MFLNVILWTLVDTSFAIWRLKKHVFGEVGKILFFKTKHDKIKLFGTNFVIIYFLKAGNSKDSLAR